MFLKTKLQQKCRRKSPEATAGEETADKVPEGNEAAEEKTEEKAKPSFFGKKKKDKKDQQIEELTDRLKRSMAEFDNFRKRTEKEKSSMYIVGAKEIIENMLPVVDNFERGLAQGSGRRCICRRYADDLQTAYDNTGRAGRRSDRSCRQRV